MKKERDTGAALPQSPFRRGTTVSQQIKIAKLRAVRSMEERRSLDNDYSTALVAIQTEIDNLMEFAKMWGMKDRSDSIFSEIRGLMNQKRALPAEFQENKGLLAIKHCHTDEVIDVALGGGGINTSKNKRQKSSSQSSISTGTAHGSGFLTPASSTAAPTESVTFTASTAARAEDDGDRNGNDEHEEEYADCNYDLREYFQPPPPPVFPTVDDDDADE